MTTLILLLSIVSAGAYLTRNGASSKTMASLSNNALKLAVVGLLTFHVAQTSNLTQAALEAGGQDEISWAMRSQAQELSADTALVATPALREGE